MQIQHNSSLPNDLPMASANTVTTPLGKYIVLSDSTEPLHAFPTSNLLEIQTSFTARKKQSPVQYKLNILRSFLAEPIAQNLQSWIIYLDLLEEVLRVVLTVVRYFPNHSLSIRQNHNLEVPHKLEVWIEGGDNLDTELDILDRFDVEWLINQPAKLRHNVLTFIK